jgi:hypothetical protein
MIDREVETTRASVLKEVKADLLKIADQGELEDLRREVEKYFSLKQTYE